MTYAGQAIRDAALYYTAHGLSVVPVDDKKVAVCKWRKLQTEIPDAVTVEEMFSNGHHGLAVVTGPVSGGLEVIDVDIKYDVTGRLWKDFAHAIKDGDPELFKSLTIARTLNRGYHIFIRSSNVEGNQKLARRPVTAEEKKDCPQVVDKVLIETRGKGGYVVAAPTPGYEFIQGNLESVPAVTQEQRQWLIALACSFDRMSDLEEEPEELGEEYSTESGHDSPGQAYNKKVDPIPLLLDHGWSIVHERGDRIYLKRPGYSRNATSANYHKVMKRLYVFTGSTEFEAGKPYSPVAIYTILQYGGDFKAAYRKLYEQGFGSRREGENTKEAMEAWHHSIPNALPDDLLPVPEFDELLLPEPLRGFVADVAERMQAPIEFVAGAAVVGAASIIGNRFQIAPKRHDDWTVVPNLWGAVIARPGKNKTSALRAGLKPVKGLEDAARTEFEKVLRNYEFEGWTRDAQRETIKAKLKEVAKSGGPTDKLRAEFEAASELQEPTPKTYIVNDATTEKIGVLLNRNSRGFLYFRDELVGFLRNLDKEENGEARAFFLETWNGNGSYLFERIVRGDTRVENMTLSILGGIQPSVFATYLRGAIEGKHRDDGLIQRFQIMFYPDVKKWKLVDRSPNLEAEAIAERCFAKLDTLCSNLKPRIVRFSEEAQAIFFRWWTDLEHSIETGEFDHEALEAHFAKYRSLMPSLALIFHLFDFVRSREDLDPDGVTDVSADATARAAAWCELLSEHARRIYGIATRQEVALAKSIIRKIRQGKLKPRFAARDLYRNGWAGLQNSQDCIAPLQLLVDFGYLFALTTKPGKGGGPTSVTYIAHPSMLPHEEDE